MRKLKILYTSDVHGYLFPTNYASTDVLPQGLFKLEAAFRPDGNTLIIDGGDMLQGSPFAAYIARKSRARILRAGDESRRLSVRCPRQSRFQHGA